MAVNKFEPAVRAGLLQVPADKAASGHHVHGAAAISIMALPTVGVSKGVACLR